MSLTQFSRRMTILADRSEKNLNRVVRRTALAVDQTVVLGTPVNTGRARSNWLVALGVSRKEEIEPYAPGERLGIGEGANAQGALAQGAGVIGIRRSGQDVFISNSVSYIEDLNSGSSQQAPANFVEQAVQAGVNVVQGARVLRD